MPGLFVLGADMKSKLRAVVILVGLIALIGALVGSVILAYRTGAGIAEQELRQITERAERDILALMAEARDEYYRGVYDACRYTRAPTAVCLNFIAAAAQSGWYEQASPSYESPPPREQTASP